METNVEKDELRKIEIGRRIEDWIISKEDVKKYFQNRRFATKSELINYYINKTKI